MRRDEVENEARQTIQRLRRFLRAKWETEDSEFFLKNTSRQRPIPSVPRERIALSRKPAAEKTAPSAGKTQPSRTGIVRHPSGIISPQKSQKGLDLLAFYERVKECKRCSLAASRTNFVFGTGNPLADVVFAGEAPGEQEDKQGLPFVGPAGQLLTRMLEAVGIERDNVFICNVLKCRPPNNRPPAEEEIESCSPYLFGQIKLLSPKIVVALGRFAAQCLLQTQKPIGQLRGRIYKLDQADLIATYHPSAILRNPNNRPILEGDLKRVRETLDRHLGN